MEDLCENDHNHEYCSFACPNCGYINCFGCSVRVTDESQAIGIFCCRECSCNYPYPEVLDIENN